MTKLKIRITQFDREAKQGKWFIDKELLETTVFLHEFDEEDFFEILEAIGKIVNSRRDIKECSPMIPLTKNEVDNWLPPKD